MRAFTYLQKMKLQDQKHASLQDFPTRADPQGFPRWGKTLQNSKEDFLARDLENKKVS